MVGRVLVEDGVAGGCVVVGGEGVGAVEELDLREET